MSGIERAIQYFHAFKAYLGERKSPYQAIVAFSGEHELRWHEMSEARSTAFRAATSPRQIQEDPYRFLICADNSRPATTSRCSIRCTSTSRPGIKAVQTLSRLNRAHPQKHDCFVLDFQKIAKPITFAFQDYYRTTLLAEETDPNKLHDLKMRSIAPRSTRRRRSTRSSRLVPAGADRDQLDPILDACVEVYQHGLDEDQQVKFKGSAKSSRAPTISSRRFCLTAEARLGEALDLLDLLIPKLPSPQEEDLSSGILEAIDMDSYRVEKRAALQMALDKTDAEIEPIPVQAGGHKPEPDLDRLSNILKTFNEQFRTLFTDSDRVIERIREDIAPKVAADTAYQNARENTPHTARMAHDQALAKVMQLLLKDDTELYKQFVQNDSFRSSLSEVVYTITNP